MTSLLQMGSVSQSQHEHREHHPVLVFQELRLFVYEVLLLLSARFDTEMQGIQYMSFTCSVSILVVLAQKDEKFCSNLLNFFSDGNYRAVCCDIRKTSFETVLVPVNIVCVLKIDALKPSQGVVSFLEVSIHVAMRYIFRRIQFDVLLLTIKKPQFSVAFL